jgi:hypothetical protein
MAIQQSNYTPAEYNAYMKELEDNAFKANDWGTMLSAAPLALGFVGECMYASASPIAAGITLQAPQGGFKHLRSGNLQSLYPCVTDLSFVLKLDCIECKPQTASGQGSQGIHHSREEHEWFGYHISADLW